MTQDHGNRLPLVHLARHGETPWSISGQHTGLTDVPLTAKGVHDARQLGKRLKGVSLDRVFTSPLQRASMTCELAGFSEIATADNDLVEWNYGDYEGKTTTEIRSLRLDWDLFLDGCPGGELVTDVAARADRIIQQIRVGDGDVLLFSHGHFLHVFAARWLGLEPAAGRFFYLDTAALSIVGYHHDCQGPVIHLWNDHAHVSDRL